MKYILTIDDDEALCKLVKKCIETEQVPVYTFLRGEDALSFFYQNQSDCVLVILDIMLPGMNGLELFRTLRAESTVPVIFLTALGDITDRIVGLELGADDYLSKPFEPRELLARIRTTLRRSDRLKLSQGSQKDVYHIKDLTVDIAKHQVLLDGEEIHFTQNEFKILELLCIHAGKVLTYDFILEHVWGPYGGTSNQILRVNMANIRRKLKENPSDPKYVLTELGIGYRMLED
mgnify:CR=1 FL=1